MKNVNKKSSVTRARRVNTRDVEYKFSAVTTVNAADSTGAIALVNGLQPGSAYNQRIGRMVRMRRIEVGVQMECTAATGVDQYQRFLIVKDNQSNGAAPAITDILDAVSVRSRKNLFNDKRFSIMHDSTVVINATGEAGSQKFKTLSIPLNYVMHFNSGVAGTVADIVSGSLFVVSIGTAVAGVTAGLHAIDTKVIFSDE